MDQMRKTSPGFSLVEMLVVLAVVGLLSGLLVLNFRSTATGSSGRVQSASVLLSDIRRMQAQAISGANYDGKIVCGFGLHYVNERTYLLYAQRVNGGSPCSNGRNRNFQSSDIEIGRKKLINVRMQFAGPFSDIFFELPDPKTYIDNTALPIDAKTLIEIVLPEAPAPSTAILVFNSGKVDVINEYIK